jgi:hypothetical protein
MTSNTDDTSDSSAGQFEVMFKRRARDQVASVTVVVDLSDEGGHSLAVTMIRQLSQRSWRADPDSLICPYQTNCAIQMRTWKFSLSLYCTVSSSYAGTAPVYTSLVFLVLRGPPIRAKEKLLCNEEHR